MTTNYPGTIDTYTHPSPNDPRSGTTSASTFVSNLQDAVSALETKVGATSSADNTSQDYKLSGVATGDKAVSKTGTETLSAKTLTAPKINVGGDATGDMYYRDGSGNFARLAAPADGSIISYASGIPVGIPNPAAANGSTTVKGVFEEATQAEVDAKTTVGGTGADLTVNPSTLRSTKYSDGVADTGSANAYVITPSPAITAYAAYQDFNVKITNTNTLTACTLNVNSLGNKNIVNIDGTSVFPGQIKAGGVYNFMYDGTNMQVRSSAVTTNIVPQKMGTYGTFTPVWATADIFGISGTNKVYTVSSKTSNAPVLTASSLRGNLFLTDVLLTLTGYTNGSAASIAVIGSYIYVNAAVSGVATMKRFDINTLANATSMTISGTSISSPYQGFSDGTIFYVVSAAATVYPYTISGTTATSGAFITFTSMTVTDGVWCDGTYVYQQYITGNVNRWPLSGGSPTALTQYPCGGTATIGLIRQNGNTTYSYAFIAEGNAEYVQPVPYQ